MRTKFCIDRSCGLTKLSHDFKLNKSNTEPPESTFVHRKSKSCCGNKMFLHHKIDYFLSADNENNLSC